MFVHCGLSTFDYLIQRFLLLLRGVSGIIEVTGCLGQAVDIDNVG